MCSGDCVQELRQHVKEGFLSCSRHFRTYQRGVLYSALNPQVQLNSGRLRTKISLSPLRRVTAPAGGPVVVVAKLGVPSTHPRRRTAAGSHHSARAGSRRLSSLPSRCRWSEERENEKKGFWQPDSPRNPWVADSLKIVIVK